MQVLQGARAAEEIPPATVVTIGMFDGVHCGHQALIRRAQELAAERGIEPLALTFDRHADEVLRPETARPYLTTLPEKVALIRSLGVALVVVARVTPAFLGIRARDFVARYLHAQLHAHAVVVGPDFRFGRGRQGDVHLLKSIRREFGYEVAVLDRVVANGDAVSSTLIRRVLTAGEVERAAALLGRPYRLSGEVQQGEEIGRVLGFPTANVSCPPRKILPALGVYVCRAHMGDDSHGAVVNVGRRPTFDGARITVEAHLLGFCGDLYGRTLTLEFLERLRPEMKFDSPDALRAQIARDVERTREAFAIRERQEPPGE
ncbi:MAG: bifunctional riboflavin kinase/FAD synthetase [Armatimonadetes bacterium]|nr:bifunctional riboflavin kinase/FAD synthetase [Armatimonadota bacterium]